MKRVGKRGRAWAAARARVKAEFALADIRCCEFGFEKCYGGNALTFAHAVKRRFISADAKPGTPEHIDTVALACLRCHRELDEEMSHAEMREAVMAAIARRAA